MMTTFTAVFEQDGDWWVGFVEELPGANTQGATLEEARENLREAVVLVLEVNRALVEETLEGRPVIRRTSSTPGGVKRRDLVRHLEAHGCALLREGANQSIYVARAQRKTSAVP